MAGQLATRLVQIVDAALVALRRRGREGDSLPVVQGLRPEHFRSEAAQQSAAWSYLANGLPLGRRLRFLLKLTALGRMLERTRAEFCSVAEEIAEGTSVSPEAGWRSMELLHDDLNTAMREAVVVLKSYLSAAGASGFAAFRQQMRGLRPQIEAGFSGASP